VNFDGLLARGRWKYVLDCLLKMREVIMYLSPTAERTSPESRGTTSPQYVFRTV
jgi:hypothetical protein